MRKIKEWIFAIVTLACVIIGGLSCLSGMGDLLKDSYAGAVVGIPIGIYVVFLAGKGASALNDQLNEKWDAEEERVREHQEYLKRKQEGDND